MTDDTIQGSPAWVEARLGRATASMFSAVMAKGQGITRTKYLRRVVCERLTGKPADTFSNAHTDRGTEQEGFARLAYESLTGNVVEEVGFIQHPTLMTGYSPDGHISIDGGLEIKSVISTVQLDTILAGGYPSEHRCQIMGSLWLSGRTFWDFASYSPDMPDHLKLYIFRVTRDEQFIATLAAEVKSFLTDVDVLVEKLKGMK